MFVVNFAFYTNRDFDFQYVPCGMLYDGDEHYSLIREFDKKEDAIKYGVKTADFFFSHIHGDKYATEYIKETLYTFEEEALANKDINIPRIACRHCSGNYDGTEFSIMQKINRYYFDIPLNDEQNEIINNNAEDFRVSLREFAYKKIEEYKKGN